MKKIKYILIRFIMFSFIILGTMQGCSSEDDVLPADDVDNIDDNTEFQEVDISVVLPEGSNLDLATTVLRSLVEDFDVSADGSTKALHRKTIRGLGFLLNQDENVILMGFVTDEKREISVRSTLEVALFYGLGTISLPQEIIDIYFNEISTGINIDELVTQTEALFLSDIR